MSIFGGLFTSPGNAEREAYNRQQKALPNWWLQFAQGYGGDPAQLAARLQQDEALQRQAFLAAYNSLLAQSNPDALGGLYAANAMQTLNSNARQAQGAARGAGITDMGTLAALGRPDALTAARAGAGAKAQGRNQANQNQLQALQMLSGLVNQNQNRLGVLGNAAGIVANRPAPATGGGNVFGGLLGTVAGGLNWDSILRGGK